MSLNYNFPKVIDSSMRSSFVACPQQWAYNYCYHLSSITPSIHLHFGAVFASGCETVRRAVFLGNLSNDDAIIKGIRRLYSEWGTYNESETEKKTLPRCIEALVLYFTEYPPRTDAIQPFMRETQGPAVEFNFGIPIDLKNPDTGEPILYAGRFDMLGVFNDSLFPIDEKTTSQLGARWAQQWDLRSQFTGYCWAAQHYGYPASGAIVRGIAIRAHDIAFADAITYRPQWQIERWYEQLIENVESMIEQYTQYKNDQRRFSLSLDGACTHYSGCTYRRLCTVPNPEPWMESEYAIREWNPLERNPEDSPSV